MNIGSTISISKIIGINRISVLNPSCQINPPSIDAGIAMRLNRPSIPKNLPLLSSGMVSHHKVMNAGKLRPDTPPENPPPVTEAPNSAARIRCSGVVLAIARKSPRYENGWKSRKTFFRPILSASQPAGIWNIKMTNSDAVPIAPKMYGSACLTSTSHNE